MVGELQCQVNEFYSGKKQQRPPLSKQKEFRAIRNAVIREAENIRLGKITFEDEKMKERGEWVDNLVVSYECLRLRARIEDRKLPLAQRDEAVEDLEQLAKYGDVHAQYFLGLLYRDGGLLLPDAEQAVHWLELAAKRNLPAAQYALGKLYLSDDPEVRDVDDGLRWLESAARNGKADAAYSLGKEYLTGKSVQKDAAKAAEYPRTKNCLAKTKGECLRKLKTLREQCRPLEQPKEIESGMTFGAWLDHWYQTCSMPALRPSTQQEYELRIYRHIIPALGEIPLNKLTEANLQQFYHQLKHGGRLNRTDLYGPGLSDRSVRGCHITCRAALAQAVEEGLISVNPAEGCKLPGEGRREMQVLTREEMQRLLIQAKEDGCYELLLLELSAGLRRGELLALQWDDLDLGTGELRISRQVSRVRGKLTVSQPKTDAAVRTIVLSPAVTEQLRHYREQVDSRWIFPSPKKEDAPRDPAAVRKLLSRVLKRAQCPKVRFHDLRHTFVTTALEYGMDVKTLSAVVGHRSSSTTLNVYTHVTKAMERQAAAKIDQGIGKQEAPPEESQEAKHPTMTTFRADPGKRRKPGTGCVHQIGEHLWEGRYSPRGPDGKQRSRNVYGHTLEACEEKLKVLIETMKAEIQAERRQLRETGNRP